MILYTIQTVEAYNNLIKNEILESNDDFIWEHFKNPYEWMKLQLSLKLKQEVDSLIWFWTEKPDLDESGHLEQGTEGVLLQVEIIDDEILTSDFDAWHAVLNDQHLTLSDKEEDLLEKGSFISKEDSWKRIFDIELLSKSDYYSGDTHIQAVAIDVKKNQILAATFFKQD